jgi:hypothetical protein
MIGSAAARVARFEAPLLTRVDKRLLLDSYGPSSALAQGITDLGPIDCPAKSA